MTSEADIDVAPALSTDYDAVVETIEVVRLHHQDTFTVVAAVFADTSGRRCRAMTVLTPTSGIWVGTGAGSCWVGSASDAWWYPAAMQPVGAADSVIGIWVDVPGVVVARITDADSSSREDTMVRGVALLEFNELPGESARLDLYDAAGGLLLAGQLWHPPPRQAP